MKEYKCDLEDLIIRELGCHQCGKSMDEGDTFSITMIPHSEGNVESGPSPPSILSLCEECNAELEEIGKDMEVKK